MRLMPVPDKHPIFELIFFAHVAVSTVLERQTRLSNDSKKKEKHAFCIYTQFQQLALRFEVRWQT